MRVFASVPLPAEQRGDLLRALGDRRTTRPDQWHLTLRFYGERDDAAELAEHLTEVAARHDPFVLRVEGGGTFTGVVWAGVSGDLAVLRSIAHELGQRDYRPHVTVARRGTAEVLAGYLGPEWVVESLDLVVSDTRDHTVLHRAPLGSQHDLAPRLR